MNENAKKLIAVCDYAASLKQFRRGFLGTDITTCNLYTRSVLSWQAARYFITDFEQTDYNYDLQTILPGGYLRQIMMNVLTGKEYDNVLKAARNRESIIKNFPGIDALQLPDYVKERMKQENKIDAMHLPEELTEMQAYDYANKGIPVVAISKMTKPLGHQCIICPQDAPYNEAKGNRIWQAGWINGNFWISEIFGEIWNKPNSDLKYFKYPQFEV